MLSRMKLSSLRLLLEDLLRIKSGFIDGRHVFICVFLLQRPAIARKESIEWLKKEIEKTLKGCPSLHDPEVLRHSIFKNLKTKSSRNRMKIRVYFLKHLISRVETAIKKRESYYVKKKQLRSSSK